MSVGFTPTISTRCDDPDLCKGRRANTLERHLGRRSLHNVLFLTFSRFSMSLLCTTLTLNFNLRMRSLNFVLRLPSNYTLTIFQPSSYTLCLAVDVGGDSKHWRFELKRLAISYGALSLSHCVPDPRQNPLSTCSNPFNLRNS